MIEINDKSIVQFVYFPKSNKTNSASYDVEIHSELTQITESFTGLTNESNSNTYYKFKIDFSKVLDGEYNYSIKDSENNVVSTGLIRVGEINNSMPEGASYDVVDEVIQYNPYGGFKWRFQDNKEIEVVENDTYEITPDEGYDALLKATVTVKVPQQTGHTDEEMQEAYQSGITEGIEEGIVEGISQQKAKLVSTAVTDNGVYSKEDGFSQVDVNVPVQDYYSSGYTSGKTDGYNSGYTVGYSVGFTGGIEEQKSKLVSTAVTENGIYSRVDGYSSINVNVPSGSSINNQTKNVTYTANTATTITFDNGYTGLQQVGINVNIDTLGVYNSGYTAGYASGNYIGWQSGFTFGVNEQKSKLTSIELTSNGTYTRENGYSAVTVNVAQTGYTQQDLDNAYASGQIVGYNSGYTAGYASGNTDGYDAGYIAGYADGYEEGSHDYEKEYLTITSLSGGSIVLKDIYSNSQISISYSINGGEWQTLTSSAGTGSSFNVNAQDVVRLKGTNSSYNNHYLFTTSAATVEGNIMSMFYCDDFVGEKSFTAASACSAFFYYSKFTSAEHLVLPATGLTNSCYENLFMGNTFLVKAPKVLPAETMKKNCYSNMFGECSSLTGSPILHATTLEENCFSSMFMNCRHLTKAPELPCETLAPWCYSTMFSGCQELVNAPNLPASALTMGCYYQMFSGCFALTQAPVLVAATVPMYGYSGIFRNCSSLNKITCLATDISATEATNNWVNGVSSAGTFTKDENMASWPTGNNGIPSGWTINNYEHDYSTDYLTFDIISGGTLTIPYNDDNYSYSLNGGEWVTVSGSGYSISVNEGDKVRFKNKRVLFTGDSNFSGNTVVYNVYGNIMSLLYSDDFIGETTLPNKNDLFYKLFAGTNVVNAEHLILPATTLKSNCYNWMFHSCRSLITAPVLPATTLATKCYFGMFDYCTSLTTAPELPAETLTSQCYSGMFEGCSNLSYIKCLATDISANNCIYEWVLSVKSNGTFIKKSGTTWPTGISGIPNNWTVQEV